jgi:glycosyltransferase involved in cell wall biosynthesis
MRPRKGLQDFLAAIKIVYQHMPNLELWIVSKEDCQIETPIPFQFIYRPSRNRLAELYASCDLFVLTSWWESFGLPPLEAMACGAPVVLTDSRGVREYARHGENCLMVPPRKPEAVARAIQRVLTDPALTKRLRQNGPPTAAKFTWHKAVDRFEQAVMNVF